MKLAHKRGGFTVIENEALLDSDLSMRAKGLLAILLSRPDGWEFRIAWLVRVSKDGRDSVRSTIRELEEAGYLVRRPVKDPGTGQWSGYDWELVSPSGREAVPSGEPGHPQAQSAPSGTASPQTGAYGEPGVGEPGGRGARRPDSSDALKKKEVIKTEKPQKLKKETPPKPPPKKKPHNQPNTDVPDWVPEELWASWVRYRKEIGKPLTPTAVRMHVRYLEEWRQKYGADLALESVRRSIARGWRGLFEPKPERRGAVPAGGVAEPGDSLDAKAKKILAAFGNARPDVIDADWRPALGEGGDD